MNQDKSIEYQSKLKEIKSLIKKIKEIDFNTSKIEKEVEAIEKIVDLANKNNYNLFENLETNTFLSDTLIQTHEKAIKKLNREIQFLKQEYNLYYKIYYASIALEEKLTEATEENITNYIKEAKTLIKQINETSQVDYELEENIVEKVYYVAYQILKLESLYSTKEELLTYMKENSISSSYICSYIEKDLKSIDLNSNIYKELHQKYLEIKKKGLDNSLFLETEFLKLLSLINNEELFDKKKETFLDKCTIVEIKDTKIKSVQKENENISKKMQELLDQRKYYKRKKLKKSLFLLGNFISVSASALGLYKLTESLAVDKTYQTTTETYNSQTGKIEKETSYLGETPNKTIITEYLPWIEPGYFRDTYTREIYTYDATNIEYDNIMDYLNKELLDQEITISSEIDEKEQVAEEDLYIGNIYEIKKVVQDLENTHEEPSQKKLLISLTIEAIILSILDLLILITVIKKSFSSLKKETKQTKQELKQAKQQLLEQSKNLEDLLIQYQELKENILKEYNELPVAIKENNSIKKRMKKLKNNQENDEDEE
ncbi:MAG: hypothetical protein MR598_05165 [Erysipelotrichaceae bacterium]|nr:hypothetical protein [Erysipelotrichaceae bacterium]